MSDPVKFTEEEMKKVQDVQDTYFNIQKELGRLSITRIRLVRKV